MTLGLLELWTMRGWVARAAGGLALGVGLCTGTLVAQSGTPAQPATKPDGNAFPGEPAPAEKAKPKPDAVKPAEGNAFPGEDTDVPIIPVDPGPVKGPAPRPRSGSDAAQTDVPGSSSPDAGQVADGDPVRSPDGAAGGDDGFSSSKSGWNPPADEGDVEPGKAGKKKTREQVLKEDVDVGNFYLEKKNWKAAQGRFEAAFALDKESPEAVWGLAEAERHLNLYAKAKEHYELFLLYDPEGPHGRAARKGLDEVEKAGGLSAIGTSGSQLE